MPIRTATIKQEHAITKQVVQRRAFKPGMQEEEDHMALYQEKFRSGGGDQKDMKQKTLFSVVFGICGSHIPCPRVRLFKALC